MDFSIFGGSHPQANAVGDGGNLRKVQSVDGRMHEGPNVSFHQLRTYLPALRTNAPQQNASVPRGLIFDPGTQLVKRSADCCKPLIAFRRGHCWGYHLMVVGFAVGGLWRGGGRRSTVSGSPL
jgi:hypothetical protein